MKNFELPYCSKKKDADKMKTRNISENEFVSKVFPRALTNVSEFDLKFAPTVIKPNTMLREDLNLDSCDTMQLIMALETKYNISIKNVYINKLVNVNDIYRCFKREISHKSRIDKMRRSGNLRRIKTRNAMINNQKIK